MQADSLPARIEHGIAELRAAHRGVTACHAVLQRLRDGAHARYSLWLDIRWPQHRSIVSGPACDSAEAALQAGFGRAHEIAAPAPAEDRELV
jgi:hypothetical protein